jgi:hypothetical protein
VILTMATMAPIFWSSVPWLQGHRCKGRSYEPKSWNAMLALSQPRCVRGKKQHAAQFAAYLIAHWWQ